MSDPIRESEWSKATAEARQTASLAHSLTCEHLDLYGSKPSLAWLLWQMGLVHGSPVEPR